MFNEHCSHVLSMNRLSLDASSATFLVFFSESSLQVESCNLNLSSLQYNWQKTSRKIQLKKNFKFSSSTKRSELTCVLEGVLGGDGYGNSKV